MKAFLIFMMLVLAVEGVSGQSAETVLIYYFTVDGQNYTRVISDTGAVNTYANTPGICVDRTPNGLFDVRLDIENPTEISIFYVPSNELIVSIPWREIWRPCTPNTPNWITDERLQISHYNEITPSDQTAFEIQGNVLREVPVRFGPDPTQVYLPDVDRSPLREYIFSNQRTKVTYLRCADGTDAEGFCTANPDWAIYDLSLSREIAVLRDVDLYRVLGQAYFRNSVSYYHPRFYRWSPDDRYFLYASRNPSVFSIYDTVAQRALDVPEQSWRLDLHRRPVWSPDSRYVAYWRLGMPDSPELYERYNITSYEDARNYWGLLIYDTQQQQIISTEVFLQLGDRYAPAIIWSPNTPELVAWGVEGDLYRLNVETGEEAVIETGVTRVTAWSYTRPIPSVALPVVTPTPTLPAAASS